MRPYGRIIPIGVILTAALLFVAIRAKSQAPAAQVWEYSSVWGTPMTNVGTKTGIDSWTWTSSAMICYATAQGCRNEKVTKSVTDVRDGAEAMMMAAAKLGEQGWELTTSTEANIDRWERILYFRRLKSDSK